MKKQIITAIALSVLLMLGVNAVYTMTDGENYIKNGSFEDLDAIEFVSCNGTNVTVTSGNIDASEGVYSIQCRDNGNYGHVGVPMSLDNARTYSYSFDIKLLSDNTGTAVTSPVPVHANFVFPDTKGQNGRNHIIDAGNQTTASGWVHYSGKYTVNTALYAADADLENAWFTVYCNNAASGKGIIFLLDNVTLVREPLESESTANLITNGSFEDASKPVTMLSCNGTYVTSERTTADSYTGLACAKITQNGGYAHAGQAVSLERDAVYDYSFAVKALTLKDGTTAVSKNYFNANFVFSDANSTNKKINHVVGSKQISTSDGWVVFSGTYTPSSSVIAADATPESAYFCIYANTACIFLVDDIVLTKRIVKSITLPALISDNMLFQQNEPIDIWGETTSTKKITATLEDENGVISTGSYTPQSTGSFKFTIPSVSAGGPYTLTVEQDGYVKTVSNVLSGELWHFSGQSNMTTTISNAGTYYDSFKPTSDDRQMRYFAYGTGEWKVATVSNVNSFASVAYFAMKTLRDGLGVPVGAVNTAVGGKAIKEYLSGGSLYNDRIVAASHMNVAGHVWYQGESDTKNTNYTSDQKRLISEWRSAWNDETSPFIIIELPQSCATIPDWWGYLDSNGLPTKTSTYNYTNVRFAQLDAFNQMQDSNVGLVVSFDIVTHIDPQKSLQNMSAQDPLHPWNKKPFGERCGLYALGMVYGKNVNYLYPVKAAMSADNGVATLTFNNVGDGLETTDGLAPRFFELAGEDGVYHAANAVITGSNTITLTSEEVPSPVMAAYAYEDHFVDMSSNFEGMDVNLTNSYGLPVSPLKASLPCKATYSKGACADVTGDVPIDNNEYASGSVITLSGSGTLRRNGHAFSGWSDGQTLYFEGQSFVFSGKSVTFTAVWTSLDEPATALFWEFNTDADTEGWSISKATAQGASHVEGGSVTASPTGTDPRMTSALGLKIDASVYKYIKIRMKNASTAVQGQLRWKRTTDADNIVTCNTQGQLVSFPVAANSDYTEYIIDMTGRTGWDGIIDRIWFDPLHPANAGSFSVDYIRVVKKGGFSVSYDENLPQGFALSSETPDETKLGAGKNYILSTQFPSSDGCTFAGWEDPEQPGKTVTAITLSQNVTLKGLWRINDESKAVIANSTSIRANAPCGIRFRATISGENRSDCFEYGFLAALSDTLTANGLTASGLEFGCAAKYLSVAAYNAADGTDLFYAQNEDGSVDFTCVLMNLPENQYSAVFTVRPYVKYKTSYGECCFYGDAFSRSFAGAAQAVKDSGSFASLDEATQNYVNEILAKA